MCGLPQKTAQYFTVHLTHSDFGPLLVGWAEQPAVIGKLKSSENAGSVRIGPAAGSTRRNARPRLDQLFQQPIDRLRPGLIRVR